MIIISLLVAIIIAVLIAVGIKAISPEPTLTKVLLIADLLGFSWYVIRLFGIV